LYATGQGVPKNDATAATWFSAAAEQGHAAAQYNLGFLYERGQGITKSDKQAFLFFSKSAAQGFSNAQAALGRFYRLGKVIESDEAMAHAWLNLAAAQGHAEARSERDTLEKTMSSADLARARQLSSGWKPGKETLQ
jgi:TPR repeat protein